MNGDLARDASSPVQTAKRHLETISESDPLPVKKARLSKRPHTGETSQDDLRDDPPAKRTGPAVEHHDFWQYPPEFWDRLSKIPLERDALEELDRRTSIRPSFPPPPTGLVRDLAPIITRELARFTKHGGPDLGDLRGYPATSNHRSADIMNSSFRSRATKSPIQRASQRRAREQPRPRN